MPLSFLNHSALRAFPLLPAALASVPFGFVLVRVRVTAFITYLDQNLLLISRTLIYSYALWLAYENHNMGGVGVGALRGANTSLRSSDSDQNYL